MLCSSTACCRRHPRACVRRPLYHATTHVHRGHQRPTNVTDTALLGSGQGFEPATQILLRLAIDGAVAITHTTAANLDFARNWYLHLQRAGVRNYALIATDNEALASLAHEVAGHVVAYPLGHNGVAQAAQAYRSRGWTRLMFAVPRMLHWVLAMGLDVLWMDTDVVALSDPFPLIRQHAAAANAANAATAVPRIASAIANASTVLPQPPRGLLLASVDGRVPDDQLTECSRYRCHT